MNLTSSDTMIHFNHSSCDYTYAFVDLDAAKH